ncbi:MAG: T9SS type A sorting domain-containing protein [Saprospiraceae bacterium]|nr:T9SS type A sorting domain-containing protein [Saprospiraceae bacterium]
MRYVTHLALTTFLTFYLQQDLFSQQGCTDQQALNHQPLATQNDGSCMYPETFYSPVFKSLLTDDLKEISGLTFGNGQWWSHNDSGNSNDFYTIEPQTGNVLKKIALSEADNEDWEDVAGSADGIFIGDFGNNDNSRTDLGFYFVPFEFVGNGNNQTVHPDEYSWLPFAYPDQVDFAPQPEESTVFDCEAFIYHNGRLHLFTKNHLDYTTTHYAYNPADHSIERLESFNTIGMITGASISPDGQVIALVGYNLNSLPTVFCWFLWDWQPGTDLFFTGNKRKIEFGSALLVGQVESIAFEGNRNGYLANEKTSYNGITLVQAGIRTFDCSAWIPGASASSQPESPHFRIEPNPANEILHLDCGDALPVWIGIYDLNGNLIKAGTETEIELPPHLPSGVYWLKLIWESGQISGRLFVRE